MKTIIILTALLLALTATAQTNTVKVQITVSPASAAMLADLTSNGVTMDRLVVAGYTNAMISMRSTLINRAQRLTPAQVLAAYPQTGTNAVQLARRALFADVKAARSASATAAVLAKLNTAVKNHP